MTTRDSLKTVEQDILQQVKGHSAVESVSGIGSYYKGKKNPKDVDVYIKLKTGWRSTPTKDLAYKIYDVQNRHRLNGKDTLLNAFLEGPDGGVLDVADLWFIYEYGEDLRSNILQRQEDFEEYIPDWKKARTIAYNKKRTRRSTKTSPSLKGVQ